ncbi:MAG: M6 family metalloprotease domain-containing protein [Bacteroidaceae bacterium]|nr:M6 family metalloprotease domain-containing protein [Bacteroidaceae bacterium]
MKKIILFCSALCMAVSSWAVPAKRVVKTVQQSDGTTLTIQLCGDETFHYYTTLDGTPVCQNDNGEWVSDSRDVASLWRAAQLRRNTHRERLAEKTRRMAQARRSPARAGESNAGTGSKKGLLILVSFTDVKMKKTSTQAVFNQMLNGLGNPYGDNYGSIREYFQDQSYGLLDLQFDVVGPFTLAHNMSYYGADSGGEGNDIRAYEMIQEACKLADSQVNYADYDWDGDGEVENIYVTYAGYAQSSGAPANTIWPHQWSLKDASGSSLTLDGVKIDTYATGSELADTSGSTIDGIGTMCHEYSHCLGLPDFYDTEGDNFGMHSWSVMDYGCYNGKGYQPAGYTAYERWFSGWLEPVELKQAAKIQDMQAIETTPEAYVVYNDANRNEYYLLANHQKTGWDSKAYGHGMLVLHVDYDANAWYNNKINNTASRQRMTIIPADGILSYSSESALAGDPWPGISNNTALTDESSPAAKLYRSNTDGQKLMHKPIENITETDGLISFDFMASSLPTLDTPVIDSTSIAVTGNSITVRWNEVENAVSYNVKINEVGGSADIAESVLLYETFKQLMDGINGDGSMDVSDNLNEFMDVKGWTGTKVYRSANGAKIGASKAGGSLLSPVLTSESGSVSFCLYVTDWINSSGKADGSTPTLSILTKSGSEVAKQTIQPDSESLLYFTFDGVPSEFQFQLSSVAGKRFYVSYVLVCDGVFSENDFIELFESDNEAPARQVRRQAPTVVSGITYTGYTFTDLTFETSYKISVQAVDADGGVSNWSDAIVITTTDATAIGLTPSVETEAREAVYYDLSGRRLGTSLPQRGIYVRGGKKAMVR